VNLGLATVESGSMSVETSDWSRMVTWYFEAVRDSARFKDAPILHFEFESSLLSSVAF
jgi:hypothetical protein